MVQKLMLIEGKSLLLEEMLMLMEVGWRPRRQRVILKLMLIEERLMLMEERLRLMEQTLMLMEGMLMLMEAVWRLRQRDLFYC